MDKVFLIVSPRSLPPPTPLPLPLAARASEDWVFISLVVGLVTAATLAWVIHSAPPDNMSAPARLIAPYQAARVCLGNIEGHINLRNKLRSMP